MKRYMAIIAATLFFSACNSNEEKKPDGPQAKADTLLEEVMDGHDVGMAKTPKLSQAQKEAQRLLDSISRLPAKSQEAIAGFKARLDSLRKDLEYADFAMDKWMEEFNYDSAKDNVEKRIEYLTEEKVKVEKVKDAILNSLAKADSVLKSKF
jgi:Na+/phosphate symporter